MQTPHRLNRRYLNLTGSSSKIYTKLIRKTIPDKCDHLLIVCPDKKTNDKLEKEIYKNIPKDPKMNYPAAELRGIKMNFYLINPDAEHRGILLIKKSGSKISRNQTNQAQFCNQCLELW